MAERVPLDQSPGDGSSILVERGPTERVLTALQEAAEARPDRSEAEARVAAVRRLATGLGAGDLAVSLDLRRPEAGHRVRSSRRGSSEESAYEFPWLVLRAGDLQVRIVRHAHRKVRRVFAQNRVNTKVLAHHLDEVWVFGPGGALRRPLGKLSRVGALDLSRLRPDLPGAERPLVATAPGLAADRPAALLAGSLSAGLLVLVAPLFLAFLGAPPPVPRDWDALRPVLEEARPPARAARAALTHEYPPTRALALRAGSSALAPLERWRTLRRAAAQDPAPEVRRMALALLAAEGEAGVASLIALQRDGPSPADRRQARRELVDLEHPLLGTLARQALAARPPASERRSWLRILGETDSQRSSRATATRALRDSDPGVQAEAAWALARLAPHAARAPLRTLFHQLATRCREAPTDGSLVAAARQVGRALLRAGGAPEALQATLRTPGLPDALRLPLERELARSP